MNKMASHIHPKSTTETIHNYSSYPLQSIWLKTNKQFFENDLGLIAFESTKRANVVAGDPLSLSHQLADQQKLFNNFVNWSHQQGKMVCGYYFSENFAKSINNFYNYKLGVSRFLDLNSYKETGFRSRDIRRAMNQGLKRNLSFVEVPHPEKLDWFSELKELEAKWIKTKRGPQIFFLLDEISCDFPGAEKERWFLVKKENQIHAFLSILPYKTKMGMAYYVDQLLQFDQTEKWALDYLIAQLLRQLKGESIVELAMGLAAFQKIEGFSPLELSFKFQRKWEPFYKTNGLYAYKKKFTSREENRYLLLDESCMNLRQIMALISVTYPKTAKF